MIIIMRMRRRRRFGRDNKLVPLQLGTSTTPSSPYLTMNIVMTTYMMMIMVMMTMMTTIQT